MGLDIDSILNEKFREIVKKYDKNNDNNLDDKECSELVFDFEKYANEENCRQMTDEFKKVVAKVSGGNQPDLISAHMDKADGNCDNKISAEIWNPYMSLYNGKTIRTLIPLDRATKSLEKYGVGSEQFEEENNKEIQPSFFDKYGGKILEYGALIGGVCLSALLFRKVTKQVKMQKEAKALVERVSNMKAQRQIMHNNNRMRAFQLVKDEYNIPEYRWQTQTYSSLQDKYYKTIRYCEENPYALRETCSKDISSFVSKSNEHVKAVHSGGWYYRYPKQALDGHFDNCGRLSLNVYPEEELIQKLDKFLSDSKIKACYKVPDEAQQWIIRHESIILYLGENISPETERQLVKLISPHTRKSTESIELGTKLSEGIYRVADPTASDVEILLKRAEEMDFDDYLINFLKSPNGVFYDRSGRVSTSPAFLKSVEMLLDKLEQLKLPS